MNIRQLECFVTLAEELHFGRTAARLQVSQSTVSELLRNLEIDLGGPLLNRTSRSVELTAFGTAFVEDARLAVEQTQAAYRAGRRLAQSQVESCLVGHSLDKSDLFFDLMAKFSSRCPGVVTKLPYMSTRQQLLALRQRRLHLAVCWMPERFEGLCYRGLGSSGLAVMLADHHRLAQQTEVTLGSLEAEPLVVWPRFLHPGMYDRFAAAMDDAAPSWHLAGTAIAWDNVAASVVADDRVGVVVRPPYAASIYTGIRCIPVVDGPEFERVAVWRRGETNKGVAALVELLEEHFAPT